MKKMMKKLLLMVLLGGVLAQGLDGAAPKRAMSKARRCAAALRITIPPCPGSMAVAGRGVKRTRDKAPPGIIEHILFSRKPGMSDLHWAVFSGDVDGVARVLASEPDDEQRVKLLKMFDDAGMTALHYATNKGYVDVVEALLNAVPARYRVGVIMQIIDTETGEYRMYNNFTALNLAFYHQFIQIGRLLLDYIPADVVAWVVMEPIDAVGPYYGWTLLHCAVHKGSELAVGVLLDKVPKEMRAEFVQVEDMQDRTALDLVNGYKEPDRFAAVIAMLKPYAEASDTKSDELSDEGTEPSDTCSDSSDSEAEMSDSECELPGGASVVAV